MSKEDKAKEKPALNNENQAGEQRRPSNHTDNSALSQRMRILDWFISKPSLTTEQGRLELDVMHPAARVMELREKGYNILTFWEVVPTASGKTRKIAKYVLLSMKEAANDGQYRGD